MVWALKKPEGFGKYWPLGDFPGWYEQLEAYALQARDEMPDEIKDRVFADADVGVDFTVLVGKFSKNDKTLPPVVEAECPREFITEKGYTELYSMIGTQDRVVAVDEAMKRLIEQFEPGVHQFFPFTITMPRGKVFPTQYYILVIRQYIEGFVLTEGTYIDDSFIAEWGPVPLYYPIDGNKSGINKVEVSKAAINGAHLWRDTRMIDPNIFISDALQAAAKKAGLTIFRHYKVRQV